MALCTISPLSRPSLRPPTSLVNCLPFFLKRKNMLTRCNSWTHDTTLTKVRGRLGRRLETWGREILLLGQRATVRRHVGGGHCKVRHVHWLATSKCRRPYTVPSSRAWVVWSESRASRIEEGTFWISLRRTIMRRECHSLKEKKNMDMYLYVFTSVLRVGVRAHARGKKTRIKSKKKYTPQKTPPRHATQHAATPHSNRVLFHSLSDFASNCKNGLCTNQRVLEDRRAARPVD